MPVDQSALPADLCGAALPETGSTSDLARLSQRLRDTEQHFQSWFEDAPIACHEIDRNGIVLRINRAESELLGFEPRQMLGRPIWDFMAPEESEKSQEVVGQLVQGVRPAEPFEREYTRQDGIRLVIEIHPKLILDGAGRITGIRAFMLDVTARKNAEAALQRQAEKLARSNAELEQFAYVASHDLQEPLRKIQAFGDRLKNKHSDLLDAQGQDYLSRMQNAAARMQALIQDLLLLSRVSSQAQPFAPVDLAEVARTVASDLEVRIEQLGARVEVGDLPVVAGDRTQLTRLLQNLVGNALKFHQPGKSPVVKIFSEPAPGDNAFCRIVVQDNGIGFDEKYLDRIFQVFQRLHGRNQYEGTGMGLAICRKIVDRHAGAITAQSEPGQGAKFMVTLPCELSLGGRPQ